MFRTTKSHYFAFQSFKNNVVIDTDHSQNSDCCLVDGVRRYPDYALLFLAGTSPIPADLCNNCALFIQALNLVQ